jgi:2-polyprenyl-3-methyl-5-hydroxy-6-metoxy-1,4-benzoquinol methylase
VGCCRKCGFVQILEKPSIKELSVLYDETYFKRGKYVQDRAINLENKRRISWLKKNGVKKGAKILDIGCATGDFIKAAKSEFHMWGVDVSEFAVKQARIENPEIPNQVYVGNIESQEFPEGFFDAIVLWDVIEHLWNPSKTILNLIKILKPGGIVVLSTPNIGSLAARLMGKYWPFITIPEHLSFFNKKTIFYLAKTSGLKPVGWMSKGKWVNLGFLLYKLNKVLPRLMPISFVHWLQSKNNLASIVLYMPSGDVQYFAAKLL